MHHRGQLFASHLASAQRLNDLDQARIWGREIGQSQCLAHPGPNLEISVSWLVQCVDYRRYVRRSDPNHPRFFRTPQSAGFLGQRIHIDRQNVTGAQLVFHTGRNEDGAPV